MKPITDLLPFVLPYARGASEPQAVAALRNAAREFCGRSKAWQTAPDDEVLSVRAGDPYCELTAPQQSELVQILQVWYHDTPLDAASEGWKVERGISPERTGSPMGYEQQVLADRALLEFKLLPTPAVSEPRAIRVRAAWRPSLTATHLADIVATRYAEQIAYGALARLHQLDEDWAKPTYAADKGAQFEQAIGVAISAVAKANVRARRRTRAYYF